MTVQKELFQLTTDVSQQHDADIFLYSGGIYRFGARILSQNIQVARQRADPKRKNVILILATGGGDPDAAYLIGRLLQKQYDRVKIVVDSYCKSSGTLLALAAHELIMTDDGELGPLDTQIIDKKENQQSSSQVTFHALNQLRNESLAFFHTAFAQIHQGVQLNLSHALQTASGIATEVLKPIYQQIDPNKLGEMSRAAQIATAYGDRLNKKSNNLKNEQTLHDLVAAYPSHGFIIDLEEAKTLFNSVAEPDENLHTLLNIEPFRTLMAENVGQDSPFICDLEAEVERLQPLEQHVQVGEIQSQEVGGLENRPSHDVESKADKRVKSTKSKRNDSSTSSEGSTADAVPADTSKP